MRCYCVQQRAQRVQQRVALVDVPGTVGNDSRDDCSLINTITAKCSRVQCITLACNSEEHARQHVARGKSIASNGWAVLVRPENRNGL